MRVKCLAQDHNLLIANDADQDSNPDCSMQNVASHNYVTKGRVLGRKKSGNEIWFVYPQSTKEFTRTRSEISLHSRVKLEFGNVGF